MQPWGPFWVEEAKLVNPLGIHLGEVAVRTHDSQAMQGR
jgi:hypothetical protein